MTKIILNLKVSSTGEMIQLRQTVFRDCLCGVLCVGGDGGAKALSTGIRHNLFLLILGTVRNAKDTQKESKLLNSVQILL